MKSSFVVSLLSGTLVSLILPIVLLGFFYKSPWGIADYLFTLMYAFLFVMSYGLVASVISFKVAPLTNLKFSAIRFFIMLILGALPLLFDVPFGYSSTIAAFLFYILNESFIRLKI
ncbi:hypothetical protein PghCCS26_61980 [Paenibacillus glycanilyticus]|uniref:Uncharacterized protein n=1 Tax=Paenibacillus glycanilyticus TaxID=126569 RepID=A0ABQ6NW23_9BACL|nr:hypothetical protein PghCCS26_61980 [Paenibacillus glycanilyticus]